MNKVFNEVAKRIDEVVTAAEATRKTQEAELTKIEAEAEKVAAAADHNLMVGNMEGFRSEHHKAIECETAAQKIREFIAVMDRPLMDESESAKLEEKIINEISRNYAAYTKKIYDHLTEIDRLAGEMNNVFLEGQGVHDRLMEEVAKKPKTYRIDTRYSPSVSKLIGDLRKLGFYQLMKEQNH